MEDVQELAKQIGRLRAAQSSIVHLVEAERTAHEAAEAEAKRLKALYDAAMELRRDKEDALRRAKANQVKINKDLSALLIRFEVANAEALRQKALLEKAAQFDRDTAEALWRKGNKHGKKAFAHQIQGAKFLAAVSRAVCADKRGLGKSLTAIAACDMAKANRILVVSPYDVVTNFYREFVDWSPRPMLFKLSDMSRDVRELLLPTLREQNNVIVFVNYEALRDAGVIEHLKSIRFDTIIADEAHKMKNSASLAFKSMKRLVYDVNICPQCTEGREFAEDEKGTTFLCKACGFLFEPKHVSREYGCSVQRVWPMTGTPILNSPEELFTLLYLIDKDMFSSESAFLNAYCVKQGNRWRFTVGGEKALMEKIATFFLRRTPDMAGVTFPEQTETFYELELKESEYPQQYAFYKLLKERALMELAEGKIVGVINAMALLTRLRQAIVYPYGIVTRDPETGDIVDRCDITESVKMDWSQDMVKSIMNEDDTNACIVFSQFKPGLRELARRFNNMGIRAVVMDGDTAKHTRDAIKADFDSKVTDIESPNRRWDVVLANYKVGGAGLNLTRANHTIILDEEWNPGMIDQAYGRNNRLDSKRPSYVHVPQVKATVDRRLRSIIMSKADMLEGFEGEAEQRSAVESLIQDILDPA